MLPWVQAVSNCVPDEPQNLPNKNNQKVDWKNVSAQQTNDMLQFS